MFFELILDSNGRCSITPVYYLNEVDGQLNFIKTIYLLLIQI